MSDLDLPAFYDDTYSHEGAEALHWEQWRRLTARGKADHITRLWGAAPPPGAVCEVGCGDGAILAELAARGFGATFDGFEVSPQAAAIAAHRTELRRVEAYDGEHLPVPDGAYDLGILSHVLEHVPDPLATLTETARACRRVAIEVPLEDNLSARRPGKVAEAQRIGHIQRFSRADMRALAAAAGLRVQGDMCDPLGRAHHQFLTPGAPGAIKWGVRAGAMALAPPLALRLFTVHYAALLVR
jgi:SAM-dependent methyltransferase